MTDFTVLSNGYMMPIIGLGTYDIKKDHTINVVLNALKLGYRHIETAPIYLNEKEIGEAIKASGINRHDLFITSKIPPHIKSYDSTLRITERIMSNLGVDYLDCLLINNPVPWGEEDKDYSKENLEVWRALEKLYEEEIIGSIGVSNFDIDDLEKLIPHVKIKPHINQLGVFVGHTLDELRSYCGEHNIAIQGHSPLARGRIFKLNELYVLAKEYGLSPAQVSIKYVLDLNVFPIIKATSVEHLKENLIKNIDLPINWSRTLDNVIGDVRDYKPPKAQRIL